MAADGIKVRFKEISPVLVEVEVVVPWPELGARLDRTYAKVGKDAHVRGFRKGKVPRAILEQYFGESVTREVVSDVVDSRLVEAIRRSGRRVVATRSIQPSRVERDKPFRFTAKLEVLPPIEEIVTEGLVAKRPPEKVADDEIDREIDRLRHTQAELVPIEPPRPARKGDVVVVDYTATLEGAGEPTSKAEGRPIEIGEPGLLPGFEEALVGANEGDERETDIAFPDDYGRKDLRGKTAKFSIRIREVRAKVLPDLDDEFARDLGDHETLADLRASVRERMEKARATSTELALSRSVLDDLALKNPVPVPAALIEAQTAAMEQELLRLVSPSDPKMRLSDEIFSELRGQAERKVRSGILVGEIARRDEIDVTDEEVDAHVEALAAQSGKSKTKLLAELTKEDRLGQVRSDLVEKKVVAGLLAKAEIREVKPASAEAKPKAGAPKPETRKRKASSRGKST